MTSDLKPYPEHKDIGLPWLDRVPVHWEIRRGKTVFDCVDVRSSSGEEELLTVSSERGIVPRSTANVTMFKAESYVGYKLCWPGDLVINSLWAWARGLGVSRYHGIISSAYGVYRPKAQYKDYSRYFHDLVRSSPYQWELQIRSKGIWKSRLQLTDTAFLEAPIILPPPEEQTAIARYLDWIDNRIRRLIRARQKQIKLLEEQKLAIIQQAVTGQIDVGTAQPFSAYKDTGVEWLGQVPRHWDERPAKYFLREYDMRSETGDEELLSVSHITGVTPRSQKNITMFKAESYVGYKMCFPGDLVINTMWAWMGAMGVSAYTGIVSSSYGVYRMRRENLYLPEYLDHLLRIRPYISEYICLSRGIRSSRLRLYPDKFLGIPIIRPPLSEQQRIVEYILNKLRSFEDKKKQISNQIELIKEYRTRLIADVVTGKVDVRQAAAQLPVIEPDDETPEAWEDEIDLDDLEEIFEGEFDEE